MLKHKILPELNNYEQAADWLGNHSTGDLGTTEVKFELSSPIKIQIVDSFDDKEDTKITLK